MDIIPLPPLPPRINRQIWHKFFSYSFSDFTSQRSFLRKTNENMSEIKSNFSKYVYYWTIGMVTAELRFQEFGANVAARRQSDQKNCQKLHKIENNWTKRGVSQVSPQRLLGSTTDFFAFELGKSDWSTLIALCLMLAGFSKAVLQRLCLSNGNGQKWYRVVNNLNNIVNTGNFCAM